MTINLNKYGESVGTRALARIIREDIQKSKEITVIDFTGIRIASNSFIDELIGVFIREYGYERFINTYKFKNANNIVKEIIKQVIYSSIRNGNNYA